MRRRPTIAQLAYGLLPGITWIGAGALVLAIQLMFWPSDTGGVTQEGLWAAILLAMYPASVVNRAVRALDQQGLAASSNLEPTAEAAREPIAPRIAPMIDRPARPQPLELGWTGTPPGSKMPFGYSGRLYATPGWCNAGQAIEAIFGRIVLCEDVPGHSGPHFSHQAEFVPGWDPYVEWTDFDIDVFRLMPPPQAEALERDDVGSGPEEPVSPCDRDKVGERAERSVSRVGQQVRAGLRNRVLAVSIPQKATTARHDGDFETFPADSIETVRQKRQAGDIDLVLVMDGDEDPSAIQIAADLLKADPSLPVFIVTRHITAEILRTALRTGAADVLEALLLEEAVEEAVEQSKLRATAEARASGRWSTPASNPEYGELIAVTSPRPGSGKTTTAINLALLLSEEPARVAVVDADVQSGSVSRALGLAPAGTLSDAIQSDRSDVAFLQNLITEHSSGVSVLAAPHEPNSDGELPIAVISRILSTLKGMFDYVIVDTRSLLDEALLAIFEKAEHVLLTTSRRRTDSSSVKLMTETLRLLGFSRRLHVVLLDSGDERNELTIQEYEKRVIRPAVVVPLDKRIPRLADGGSVVEGLSDSPAVHAYREIVDLVADRVRRRPAS